MKPYVYIVVRKDIKPCNYAPQIAHAALEAGYQSEEPNGTTHIVVLQVDCKMDLDMLVLAMFEEGIVFESFYEGFADMGLTAVATLPTKKLEGSCLQTLELFSYGE